MSKTTMTPENKPDFSTQNLLKAFPSLKTDANASVLEYLEYLEKEDDVLYGAFEKALISLPENEKKENLKNWKNGLMALSQVISGVLYQEFTTLNEKTVAQKNLEHFANSGLKELNECYLKTSKSLKRFFVKMIEDHLSDIYPLDFYTDEELLKLKEENDKNPGIIEKLVNTKKSELKLFAEKFKQENPAD